MIPSNISDNFNNSAQSFANLCLVNQHQYDEAIDNYTDILNNAPTFVDSIYAEMDIETALFDQYLYEGGAFINQVGVSPDEERMNRLNDYQTRIQDLNTALVDYYQSERESQFSGSIPSTFALHQNSPNPFNPTTRITYSIFEKSQISVKVFDIMGREVCNLVDGIESSGDYSIVWDATGMASGIYFVKMEAKSMESGSTFSAAKKMLLLK